ncbi:MAG: hypothetical protein K2X49_13075 [Acetobacteraceae bacterium]|nr:hypothetical protein [Acetobacteraceae bacterium]
MPPSHLLLVAVAAFGWSSGWMAARYALDAGMPPLLFGALRSARARRPPPARMASHARRRLDAQGVGAQGLPLVAVWLGMALGAAGIVLLSTAGSSHAIPAAASRAGRGR